MGNVASSSSPGQPPLQVASLPVQRQPVRDGASGLHYSGRIYTNQYQELSSDICNGATATIEQIGEVMPNSISSTSLPIDDTTKRASASALQAYVQNLINTGRIPGTKNSFDEQTEADAVFYKSVQAEYCFYEVRYVAALKQFVALVADAHGAPVDSVLNTTVDLNKRLNSLLEIMNYVGNERAAKINKRSPTINEANDKLKDKISVLKKQQNFLESSDVRIRTQEEMMRFSAEKSRAMNIQIMFFVALNVVALGTILTVYKGVKPSV